MAQGRGEAVVEHLDVTVTAEGSVIATLRERARAFAERHGVARPDDVELAVAEACGNAIAHAYAGVAPGVVSLLGERDGDSVWITVSDEGSGLVPRPDRRGGGMGLPIMAQLADRVEITSGKAARGTRVRMGFTATGRAAERS